MYDTDKTGTRCPTSNISRRINTLEPWILWYIRKACRAEVLTVPRTVCPTFLIKEQKYSFWAIKRKWSFKAKLRISDFQKGLSRNLFHVRSHSSFNSSTWYEDSIVRYHSMSNMDLFIIEAISEHLERDHV